ncbi:hypothetical protein ACFP3I_22150 [Chryseobacterium arachidis]|uniref:hypothetical protein n=1 Tax=Chryseobacterium arachidis TaxID=1416778 RepID=UPI00093387B0
MKILWVQRYGLLIQNSITHRITLFLSLNFHSLSFRTKRKRSEESIFNTGFAKFFEIIGDVFRSPGLFTQQMTDDFLITFVILEEYKLIIKNPSTASRSG